MIKNTYEVKLASPSNLRVTLVAESVDYDSRAKLRYLGDSAIVALLKSYLADQRGFYGHSVNPETVNLLDLDCALKQLQGTWLVTESSKNTIKVSELPDGAIS